MKKIKKMKFIKALTIASLLSLGLIQTAFAKEIELTIQNPITDSPIGVGYNSILKFFSLIKNFSCCKPLFQRRYRLQFS